MWEKNPDEVISNNKGKKAVISFDSVVKLAEIYKKPIAFFAGALPEYDFSDYLITIDKLEILAGAGSEGLLDNNLLKSTQKTRLISIF